MSEVRCNRLKIAKTDSKIFVEWVNLLKKVGFFSEIFLTALGHQFSGNGIILVGAFIMSLQISVPSVVFYKITLKIIFS